jgi:DNA helicase HerA-like ATPase
LTQGETILRDIDEALTQAKTVLIDTSFLQGEAELLLCSVITRSVFDAQKWRKKKGQTCPIVSVVLEEAPRVIGKDVLEKGMNVFGTIAREGRKFGVGLVAITQLPSLIPKDILANMNTKIIMGLEMSLERAAVVESSTQDISRYDREIASLAKGEALVSSTFTRFALPIRIPLFSTIVLPKQPRALPGVSK